ncbi:MAG: hypothetical protein RL757_865 [Bacteroidota bacterium]|jgi:hypothetical protein
MPLKISKYWGVSPLAPKGGMFRKTPKQFPFVG